MAGETVHVVKITQGWPREVNGFPQMCTIDLQVDGAWVRMGYETSQLIDSSTAETLLKSEADVLTDENKQHASQAELGTTPVGTDRSDLVPDDFVL